MGMGDKRRAKLQGIAQEQVAEPVLAAAVLTRPGNSMSRSFGLVGAAVHAATATDTGFAPYNLVAVTEGALHVFEVGGNTTKVKSMIGTWHWSAFRASVDGRGLSRKLTLQWADGTESKLEAPVTGVQKFQLDALDQIVRRTAEAQDGGPALGYSSERR